MGVTDRAADRTAHQEFRKFLAVIRAEREVLRKQVVVGSIPTGSTGGKGKPRRDLWIRAGLCRVQIQ